MPHISLLPLSALLLFIACDKPKTQAILGENKDTVAVDSLQKGVFIDSRDGQKYHTVNIGGKTWMAENLNYIINNSSVCYDNDELNCKKYGRLYIWEAAIKACPDGWHLPSRGEWDILLKIVDGNAKKLKSKTGWVDHYLRDGVGDIPDTIFVTSSKGTDDYGFSALPGGFGILGNPFGQVGYYGNWWSATESRSGYDCCAYGRYMIFDKDGVFENESGKDGGFSVRCVQN